MRGLGARRIFGGRFLVGALSAALFAPLSSMADDADENRYLDMDLAQLMDIQVTSVAKKKQSLTEAAAAVYVISQEDIRRSGVTSIPEALAMAPGIQAAQINASKWSVSSRGFAGYTSNKLLILIDGRSVYTPGFSGVFWEAQHVMLEDVERIEVIRGPAGTTWGANAVNGVINIITKSARDTEGTVVRLGVGSEDRLTAAARQGIKLSDKASLRLYAMGEDHGSSELPEPGMNGDTDGGDAWKNAQGGFRADGNPTDNDEWTLQGDVYRQDGNQIFYPQWLFEAPYLTASRIEMDVEGANLIGRWQHHWDEHELLTVKSYYDYAAHYDGFVFTKRFSTFDFETQYETRLAEIHDVIVGGGYRRLDTDHDQSVYLSLPDGGSNLYSLFLQDTINLFSERVLFTLGMKWEHNDYTGGEWQPSGKLLWKATDDHTLWASLARAVRLPSTLEREGAILFGSQPLPDGRGLPIYFRGNEDFDSEEALSYELGWRWQASRRLQFDLALFYTDYKNLYSLSPRLTPTSLDMMLVNTISGENYGLELSAEYKPTKELVFSLAYSFLQSNLHDDVAALNGNAIARHLANSTAQNLVSLRGGWEFIRNWQFNAWLRYVDSYAVATSVDLMQTLHTIDDAFLLDLNLIWRARPDLEFMLSGRHLLHESRVSYISEHFNPESGIERAVYGKVTWKF
jgi:iron complex outermembrane receptor protein